MWKTDSGKLTVWKEQRRW